MPTATKTRSATSAFLTRILDVLAWLKEMNIERDEDLELLLLCVLAGQDPLFLGEPGVGKTYFIELFTNHVLKDAALYTHLLAKDQSADELLGPRDIIGYKEGKVRRLTEGYSPTSNVSYWDEVFKSSPPMLNPALDLLANRKLKMGGEVLECPQLITIVMSSNELPEREDLQAFRDRIALTKQVLPIRTDEGRRALIDLQLDGQGDIKFADPLSLEEIAGARAEAHGTTFPDTVREKLVEAWRGWADAGHSPSGRRIGQMQKVMKAHAWLHGRASVNADDLLVCQHMAWNKPDDAKTAREVVIALAEAFTREALELMQTQEPLLQGVQKLTKEIESAQTSDDEDELRDNGFKLTRQMKALIRKADELRETGERDGEDISRVVEVHDEIERQMDWANAALSGTDL